MQVNSHFPPCVVTSLSREMKLPTGIVKTIHSVWNPYWSTVNHPKTYQHISKYLLPVSEQEIDITELLLAFCKGYRHSSRRIQKVTLPGFWNKLHFIHQDALSGMLILGVLDSKICMYTRTQTHSPGDLLWLHLQTARHVLPAIVYKHIPCWVCRREWVLQTADIDRTTFLLCTRITEYTTHGGGFWPSL